MSLDDRPNMNRSGRVVVVGGGAAGFFGAIACARANADLDVTVLEAGPQFLSKVLISGGGRCNVTHACFEPSQLVQHYPRGAKALRGVFSRFQPRDTVTWFVGEGVLLKTEPDGRMFPITDRSSTIADCLMRAAERAGVRLRSRAAVSNITHEAGQFQVQLRSGEILTADRVLLATGSQPTAYRWAAGLGHPIMSPVPSLFTLAIPDPRLDTLAGLAVERAQVRLVLPEADRGGKGKKPPDSEQIGPVLITHWGLSGPAVLRLSAWAARSLHEAHYRALLRVNWLGTASAEEARDRLRTLKQQNPRKAVSTAGPPELPKRLWQKLVEAVGVAADFRWADLPKGPIEALVRELVQGEFKITGKAVFKEEFVTCGGIDLKSVDFKTLESRSCPGLHFAGEILDIDGITGGFNFQSAWSTGWIAGQAIAQGVAASPSGVNQG